MKISIVNILLIIVLTILIGALIGTLIEDFPYFTLKRDISPIEIANLIVAILIATYIRFFLDRRINDKRIEKDILIQACNKLNDEIYDLKKTIIDPAHISQEIIKAVKARTIIIKIRSISNLLGLLINNTARYADNKEIKRILEKLEDNQDVFWTDLTFNLQDRKAKITQEIYRKTEGNINQYSANISELIMRINGC